MFVMFMTAYSIGEEVKRGTSRKWLEMGRNSIVLSLMGKLIPQAVVFICMGMFYLSLLYVYARFPLNGGFFPDVFRNGNDGACISGSGLVFNGTGSA